MGGMVLDVKLPVEHLGDAAAGPAFADEPPRFRASAQEFGHLRLLARGEAGRPAWARL